MQKALHCPNLVRSVLSLLLFASVAKAQSFGPDITVATDGSGNFKTVQEAVESIPKDNTQRIIVLIKDGTYKEKVRLDASYVTLQGQSRNGTRIEFAQDNEAFNQKPDKLGRAVLNINGSDAVIENLTIQNTAGVIGPHAFAVYGTGDRTVIIDSDVLSDGADTVSLWRGKDGRYYHARCNFCGSVDFVCPRGWCYVTDCTFYEKKAGSASVWHDGHNDKDQKFVLRNCKFDGIEGFWLGRHHQDGQFYFLDCTFSKTLADHPIRRVIYPLSATNPTTQDAQRNKTYDKTNVWGEREYFYGCHRDGGDYAWFADNLSSAPGSPTDKKITAAWTFDDKWNPERTDGPRIVSVSMDGDKALIEFSEPVTVKGKPMLELAPKAPGNNTTGNYDNGSGSKTLVFDVKPPLRSGQDLGMIAFEGGAIIASEAGATIRQAESAGMADVPAADATTAPASGKGSGATIQP
jgi:pectinesterase